MAQPAEPERLAGHAGNRPALQHWRHHEFSGIRPFFSRVEAVETTIWLTEVAPQIGKIGEGFLPHLVNANNDANPELRRLALKLATRVGNTMVMAMLIAWQTINAVRPLRALRQDLSPSKSRNRSTRSCSATSSITRIKSCTSR
ncbi:MAG: hypothetical protein JNK68_10875 [Betaproteobacteria bacterium]|nr:hypothetical protein [Betaproteobacteria bacterium]